MAKVLGESGRYVTEQAVKKYRNQLLAIYIFGSVAAFLLGYMFGKWSQPYITVMSVASLVIFPIVIKRLNRFIEKHEKERLNFRKGAVGEAVIGHILNNFPEDFYVIHDITTSFGNIDHVVVGPTGAYIIDTKNWKGVVEADGSGELLLNGKPTPKPEIKNITQRIMNVKEKIKILSSLKDPYIRGLLVFPSAYVEAKWGSTGYVHCLRDEQLYDYIVENKKGNKLAAKEVDAFSQSFLALARMDKDFA